MMLSWKMAACLAAGNTVVIKPAQVLNTVANIISLFLPNFMFSSYLALLMLRLHVAQSWLKFSKQMMIIVLVIMPQHISHHHDHNTIIIIINVIMVAVVIIIMIIMIMIIMSRCPL